MPFKTLVITSESSDGRNFKLILPCIYETNSGETITIPAGSTSDGASTPREIWNLIPPFGKYWMAAVLHDYLYRFTQRPKSECDLLLLEAMQSLGVGEFEAKIIYDGVRDGGQSSFDQDRKAQQIFLNPEPPPSPVADFAKSDLT